MSDHLVGKLRIRIKKKTTASTLSITGPQVPEKEKYFLERITFKTDTTANADCVVSLKQRGYNHVIHQFTNSAKGEFLSDRICVFAYPYETLIFEIDGIINGEEVEIFITGSKYYYK